MNTIPDPNTRPLRASLHDGSTWLVTELDFREVLCEPYTGEATLLARNIDPDNIIGQPVSVRYAPGTGQQRQSIERYFHGLITAACHIGYSHNGALQRWKITFRPWLWLLTLRTHCRIFQSKTSLEIIDLILHEHGLKGSYRFDNRQTPSMREYCVQYNESDGAFISRLLQQDGLFYFFEHKAENHQMIVGDSNHTFTQCNENVGHYIASENYVEAVKQWHFARNINPRSHNTRGYEPQQAAPTNSGSVPSAKDWNTSMKMDCHSFDPRCITLSDSRRHNNQQIEADDVRNQTFTGESAQAGFRSGGFFRLNQHPDPQQTGDYLLLAVSHHLSDTAQTAGIEYSNSFSCIPMDTPYRPPMAASPRITSLQSARVCGPQDNEIYTDGKGAIKVRFHWDQADNNDEDASCWLRVMQPLCGNGFGFQILPRVGDEVLVGFIDGCPDLPMVLGSAWNGEHQTPFDTAEVCGLISRSTTQGDTDESSHLLFDDRREQEKVQLRAQKDLEVNVLNNRLVEIGNDEKLTVKGTTNWHTDKSISVSTDDRWQLKTKQNMDFETSASSHIKATSNFETHADSSQKHSANNEISFDATSIKMTAKNSIELCVGASKIKISPDGVKIEAPQVSINGQMRAELKSVMTTIEGSGMTQVKGMVVSVEGTTISEIKGNAMVKIQGGLTMIN